MDWRSVGSFLRKQQLVKRPIRQIARTLELTLDRRGELPPDCGECLLGQRRVQFIVRQELDSPVELCGEHL